MSHVYNFLCHMNIINLKNKLFIKNSFLSCILHTISISFFETCQQWLYLIMIREQWVLSLVIKIKKQWLFRTKNFILPKKCYERVSKIFKMLTRFFFDIMIVPFKIHLKSLWTGFIRDRIVECFFLLLFYLLYNWSTFGVFCHF